MSKPKSMMQPCDKCDSTGEIPADDVGVILREMREKAGVSGTALAVAMGIGNEFLYDMERGGRKVSNKHLKSYLSNLEELASVKA